MPVLSLVGGKWTTFRALSEHISTDVMQLLGRPRTVSTTDLAIGGGAGYPRTDDLNGYQQEGFGPMEATIWKGRRWSAANAYLRPALKTGRLTLIRDGRQQEIPVQVGRRPSGAG